MAGTSSPKKKRRIWIVVLILCLLMVLAAAVVYIIRNPWWVQELDPDQFHHKETEWGRDDPGNPGDPSGTGSSEQASQGGSEGSTDELGLDFPRRREPDPGETEASGEPGSETGLRRNPVDFDALAKINPDIYAWIYIPMGNGKDIDLPVLQAAEGTDNDFYLHHSIYKQYLFSGSIYTQRQNSKDFNDRVTVIYGHNMKNGTKFSNLVLFTYKQVFDAHDVFYIYIPGHILTYKIAAGIEFDKRHILYNFDFSDDQVFADWIQNYILSPKVMVRNVRKGIQVTTDDKLVILSTCLVHNKSRYLIQGVLINDEPTR